MKLIRSVWCLFLRSGERLGGVAQRAQRKPAPNMAAARAVVPAWVIVVNRMED